MLVPSVGEPGGVGCGVGGVLMICGTDSPSVSEGAPRYGLGEAAPEAEAEISTPATKD